MVLDICTDYQKKQPYFSLNIFRVEVLNMKFTDFGGRICEATCISVSVHASIQLYVFMKNVARKYLSL